MDKITFKEDNKFTVYGGWKNLTHGCETKMEASMYPNRENLTDEIQRLVKLSNIDELLEQAKQEEENVYVMYYKIYESEDYNYRTNKKEKVFYVTWDVYVDGINSKRIAGQRRKRYTDKQKALKYIEGRIKAYSHLFQEITPEIPTEYENLFMKNGILLEGYKVAN